MTHSDLWNETDDDKHCLPVVIVDDDGVSITLFNAADTRALHIHLTHPVAKELAEEILASIEEQHTEANQ